MAQLLKTWRRLGIRGTLIGAFVMSLLLLSITTACIPQVGGHLGEVWARLGPRWYRVPFPTAVNVLTAFEGSGSHDALLIQGSGLTNLGPTVELIVEHRLYDYGTRPDEDSPFNRTVWAAIRNPKLGELFKREGIRLVYAGGWKFKSHWAPYTPQKPFAHHDLLQLELTEGPNLSRNWVYTSQGVEAVPRFPDDDVVLKGTLFRRAVWTFAPDEQLWVPVWWTEVPFGRISRPLSLDEMSSRVAKPLEEMLTLARDRTRRDDQARGPYDSGEHRTQNDEHLGKTLQRLFKGTYRFVWWDRHEPANWHELLLPGSRDLWGFHVDPSNSTRPPSRAFDSLYHDLCFEESVGFWDLELLFRQGGVKRCRTLVRFASFTDAKIKFTFNWKNWGASGPTWFRREKQPEIDVRPERGEQGIMVTATVVRRLSLLATQKILDYDVWSYSDAAVVPEGYYLRDSALKSLADQVGKRVLAEYLAAKDIAENSPTSILSE